jgi:hypothetical protein
LILTYLAQLLNHARSPHDPRQLDLEISSMLIAKWLNTLLRPVCVSEVFRQLVNAVAHVGHQSRTCDPHDATQFQGLNSLVATRQQ